jgi:hypothetical protein
MLVFLFPCFDNEKRHTSLATECERTHVCLIVSAYRVSRNNFVSPVGVRERAKSKLSKHFQGRNGPTPTVNHAPATAARLPEVCRCDSGCYVSAAVRHYYLLLPTGAAGPKGLHRRISVHTWTERGYAPPRNNPFNNGSLKMCEQENGETLFSPLIEDEPRMCTLPSLNNLISPAHALFPCYIHSLIILDRQKLTAFRIF